MGSAGRSAISGKIIHLFIIDNGESLPVFPGFPGGYFFKVYSKGIRMVKVYGSQ